MKQLINNIVNSRIFLYIVVTVVTTLFALLCVCNILALIWLYTKIGYLVVLICLLVLFVLFFSFMIILNEISEMTDNIKQEAEQVIENKRTVSDNIDEAIEKINNMSDDEYIALCNKYGIH